MIAGGYGNAAVVPVSCPFGSTEEFNPVFITGFNVEEADGGVLISWISTGAEVRRFHILRRNADGTLARIAEGDATSYRLSRILLRDTPVEAVYFLEIVDPTGWITKVGTDGSTQRIADTLSATKARAESVSGRVL